ncbi:type II toxin-antitoxin system RatA family toxin [Georhizobium profundi]|uniref:Type II toxin-antitoxin system RatA family toxin n=1 Tax=Georhizobium profundi TaxID=2341112 RepID=A0A3S9B596_9HYPH|nr:type II toxin-antitoxin system RatA family toxin [Georhizobium profundi]AZN72112.1 type II toxin-antitoxin system RatA family toxin [Georhizobium profundi]
MPQFETTRHVNHSASDMFALVADVERYPEFLPLCESLTVRSRKEGEDGKELLVADMAVGYKAIRETFASQVVLRPAENRIDVKYIDGPFRYLDNRWTFEDKGKDSCAVHFFIDYQFRNRMLGMLMGTMFDRAFRTFAEAFERRADEIYGRRKQTG